MPKQIDDEKDRYGPGPLKGMRVLIIEDNSLTAYVIESTLLEHGGRSVGVCQSGRDAMRLLDQCEIDFALIDLRLVDGFADDVIQHLVKDRINFAIITGMLAVPANFPPEAVAILHKPVKAAELITTLAPFA
ncbi:MAG: response regulator [Hyphomicrobiaceae bacterium]